MSSYTGDNITLGEIYAEKQRQRQQELRTMMVHQINIGSTVIYAEDILKFRRMLEFMEFALAASEELRSLMVAFEAKQRLLK